MVDKDIETRVLAMVTRYSGVYLFRKKKYEEYTPESSIHFDVKLDQEEAEELMEEFFQKFNVKKEGFDISNYYPEVELSWNPFKKQVVDIPEFKVSMLIESAKAGRWLYD